MRQNANCVIGLQSHYRPVAVPKHVDSVMKWLQLAYNFRPFLVVVDTGRFVSIQEALPPVVRFGGVKNRDAMIPHHYQFLRDRLAQVVYGVQHTMDDTSRSIVTVAKMLMREVHPEHKVHGVNEHNGELDVGSLLVNHLSHNVSVGQTELPVDAALVSQQQCPF